MEVGKWDACINRVIISEFVAVFSLTGILNKPFIFLLVKANEKIREGSFLLIGKLSKDASWWKFFCGIYVNIKIMRLITIHMRVSGFIRCNKLEFVLPSSVNIQNPDDLRCKCALGLFKGITLIVLIIFKQQCLNFSPLSINNVLRPLLNVVIN